MHGSICYLLAGLWTLCFSRRPIVGVLAVCIHDMLLLLCVMDSLFFMTHESKRVLMPAMRYKVLTRWFVASLYFATPSLLILFVLDSLSFATPKSKRVLMHAWRHMLLTLWVLDSLLGLGRAQVPYSYCMHFAK